MLDLRLILLAPLLAVAAANAQPLARGLPFLVNTFAPGSPGAHHLATDAAGRFVVAWESPNPANGAPSQDGSGPAILVRRFDADGTPLSDEILVNTTTEGPQLTPSVAAASDGRFVVLWWDRERLLFQRFDAGGTRLGGETQVSTPEARSFSGLVAANAAGDFAAVWSQADPQPGNPFGRLRARFYAADGSPRGPERELACGFGQCYWARPVALADGGFLLHWFDNPNPNAGLRAISARRFDAAGNDLGEVALSTAPFENPTDFHLAAAPSGELVATWLATDWETSGRDEVFVRRFDSNGAPLGPVLRAGGDGPHDPASSPFAPRAVVLEDGSFVVGWTDWMTADNPFGGFYTLRARWFDADGRPIGAPFGISAPGPPDALELELAAAPGNRFVAAWASNRFVGPGPDGSDAALLARIFAAPKRGAVACASIGSTLRCDLDRDGAFDLDLPLAPGLTGRPMLANLDGDGRPDLCTVSGNRFRCDFSGSGGPLELDLAFGPPGGAGMTPLLANPNGDSRDDLALARGRLFAFDTAHNAGKAEVKIRLDVQPGDVPLAGDLDGDGDDEPCLARGTRFLCDLSHDGLVDLTLELGLGTGGGDQPLLADADGNGSDDPCVLRGNRALCDTAHDGGIPELELLLPPGSGQLVLGNPFRH